MPIKFKPRWSEGWEDFEFPTPSQQKELAYMEKEYWRKKAKEETNKLLA